VIRGRPLGIRLAVLLAGVLVVVLLAAGWVVNRAASRSLGETLRPRDEQRLELAVAIVEDALARGAEGRGLDLLLGRIAQQSGGEVRLLDSAGNVTAHAGHLPPSSADTQRFTRTMSTPAGGGTFELAVPSPEVPFLRTFNTVLLLTGGISVLALLGAAALLAGRLTRPLREVAAAARRLGAGDLRARAPSGPDAESAELAASFNEMADRLERSEELRRRATSDMAHDLATPATLLESQLQAMVDGIVPADREGLERARSAAVALNGVIVQLGDLIDAESAALDRRLGVVEVAELLHDVEAALGALASERSVRLEIHVESPAPVTLDRAQVARALRNVVTNAIQHTPPPAAVQVVATGRQVRVIDQGPGIAAADQPHVFERFYRADRARRRGNAERSGSGIGLTIARDLLAANGGRIEIERTGPEGTTFLVTLPG
jgi:signal transduction histidine kinase